MAVNYSYGNPADTMTSAVEQLKKYYNSINSPDINRMEDAYTRDNVNASGQANLLGALNNAPRTGQIGSGGNVLTMKALNGTIGTAPNTYANLIASQRNDKQSELSNYINGASALTGTAHSLGMADSSYNDRVKQFAVDMARQQLERQQQEEIDRRNFEAQKSLMKYKNELNSGSGFWSGLLGGLGTLGSLALAPVKKAIGG